MVHAFVTRAIKRTMQASSDIKVGSKEPMDFEKAEKSASHLSVRQGCPTAL